MTDKDLILETLKTLKSQSGHTDIVNTLWKDLNLDKNHQSHLRDILLTGELINLGADLWTMQLTARGMLLKPYQLDENGSLKLESIINEQKDEIRVLEKEKLKLEIKHLQRKEKYAVIGFIAGAILTLCCMWLTNRFSSPSKIQEEKSIKMSTNTTKTDTVFQIKSDTLKNQ